MTGDTFRSHRIQAAIGGLTALCLAAAVITTPLDLQQQILFALAVIGLVLVINLWKSTFATLVICVAAAVVSTRYIVWRATSTLEFQSIPAALLGGLLFATEAYAWLILILGFLQTAWPMERKPVPMDGEPEDWPLIDVFVPTYNEPLDIVRQTIFAAQAMDYPSSRFNVYILDDGRRAEFRAFAHEAGCGYLTRKDNLHAKAGNLNAAMRRANGAFVVVFDCDHVPTRAFLQLTVGWFQKDPKLALLQTPHYFYSPDPVQRNLHLEARIPGEGELFYGPVQKGNDLWNAAFFCGSCAVIRRAALDQIGGFAGETVTEDAHTALKLQRRGWNTAYLDARLAAGLATERLAQHIRQRNRWARGMTQILRMDNPLFGPGLNLYQRLCYLNAMLHFQFPVPRLVFLLSPLAYLIFGESVIHASASLIFAYALPHLFTTMRANERLQSKQRGPFWGEIYEALLAFHLALPTLATFFDPRRGRFNVTDKGATLNRGFFDAATLTPHLIAAGLLAFGLVVGFAKLAFANVFHEELSTLLLNTAWTVFSLFILLAAISVGREARQMRGAVRIPFDQKVTLYSEDGYVADGAVRDISKSGLAVLAPPVMQLGGRKIVDIDLASPQGVRTLPVRTVALRDGVIHLAFGALSLEDERALTAAVMGRADAWIRPAVFAPAKSSWSLGLVPGLQILATAVNVLSSGGRSQRKTAKASAPKRRRAGRPELATSAIFLAGCLGLVGASALAPLAHASELGRSDPFASNAPALEARNLKLAELQPEGGEQRTRRFTLRDLRIASKIRLAGAQGEIGIPFGLRRDEVVTGASVNLTFAHSPSLIADISQLVVLVNGEVVKTLPLTAANVDETVVNIPINPSILLPGDNQINIRLIAHYTHDCEDPLNSTLWANVSNTRSWIDLTLQHVAAPPNLAQLPAPFFDRSSEEPLVLPFVFAPSPQNGELEAAAATASWFGAMASYRGYAFKPLIDQLPAGNAVVFLTPDRPVAGLKVSIGGPTLEIIANPKDPSGRLLIVAGRSDAELKLAAAALSAGGRYSGDRADVGSVKIPVFAPYGAPRWLPTNRPVQLGELVDPLSLEGRGLPPGPLTARFQIAPDLFFWPQAGARLDSTYRYPKGRWLDQSRTRLDLSLNDRFLQTLPMQTPSLLDRLSGTDSAASGVSTAQAILPSYLLFGQNELVYYFDLNVAGQARCNSQLPTNVRVSIDPRTTIDLRGAYHAARLPNLAFFASAGFPFTRAPDLGDTVVILGPDPSGEELEAFLAIMGRIGDATGAPAYRLTVSRTYLPSEFANRHILVIGPTTLSGLDPLFADAPVHLADGRLHLSEQSLFSRTLSYLRGERLDESALINETLVSGDSFSGMVSFKNPGGDGSVVAVLASRPDLLPALAYSFQDPKLNAQIQGDLAVLTNDGVQSYNLAPLYWYGHLPFWISVEYELSRHPFLLAIFGMAAAILLTLVAAAWLKRRQSARLGPP